MNIELELISKVLEEGSIVKLMDKQINHKYFSGKNKLYFKYINEYQKKYGKTPSLKVFLRKFPSVELPEAEEEIDYYCDEVREKFKHNTMVSSFEKITDDMNNFETEEAYKKAVSLVYKIENEIVLSDRKKINENTKDRMKDYLTRAKSGGITGIPTGIDLLDKAIKGCNNGELITILGYTGSGKSFLEVIIACNMAKEGFTVLFITTEMSTDAIMRRVDAIWNKFSYTDFRDGTMSPKDVKKYERYLEKMEGSDFNLIVEQATAGVGQIAAKMDQYNPDMVIIDGAYMLDDDDSEDDDWKALVRIWRGLHTLALTKKKPILASTQSKDEHASLKAISFAKAIAAYCDVIVGLEADEQMHRDRELALVPLKIREGVLTGKIIMNFDMNVPDWSTIYTKDSKEFEKVSDEDVPEAIQKI